MAGSEPGRPSVAILKCMEWWAWALILRGLLALTLGIFLLQGEAEGELLGGVSAALGGLAVVGGTLLIGLRSRWA